MANFDFLSGGMDVDDDDDMGDDLEDDVDVVSIKQPKRKVRVPQFDCLLEFLFACFLSIVKNWRMLTFWSSDSKND